MGGPMGYMERPCGACAHAVPGAGCPGEAMPHDYSCREKHAHVLRQVDGQSPCLVKAAPREGRAWSFHPWHP